LVEGGDRHSEIFGELFHGDEPIPVFHVIDHGRHPFGSLSCVIMAGLKGLSKGFPTLC
jgi:hypothetical protein